MFRIINVIFASIFFLYHQGISQTQTLNSAPTFLQFSYTTGNILEVAPSASAIISSVTQSTVATGYTGTVVTGESNLITIRLCNNSGILLHTEKKQVKNGQNTFTLENDSNLINGTYLIELITPNGKAIYTRFIILR